MVNDLGAARETINSMKLWPIFCAFFLSGVAGTILGPLLPALSARLQLGDGGSGALFTAQFGGAAFGALICGTLLARWGYRRVLVLGYLMLAAGGVMLAATHAWIVALGILLTGLGLGVLIPPSNLLVAETVGDRKAAGLNWLNLCYGTGAVAGPVLVAWLRDHTGLPGVAVLVAVSGIGSALALALTVPRASSVAVHEEEGAGGRFQWAVAATLFLYVGAETTLSGWLPTLAVRRLGAGSGLETAPLAAFWGCVLVGRVAAVVLMRWFTFPQLMRISLIVGPVAAAALAFTGSISAMTLIAALAGLVFGPVFPNTVATLESGTGNASRRLGPPVFAAGAAGGAVVPWIAGWVSSGSSDVRVILWPVLVCLALMWPAWAGVRRSKAG